MSDRLDVDVNINDKLSLDDSNYREWVGFFGANDQTAALTDTINGQVLYKATDPEWVSRTAKKSKGGAPSGGLYDFDKFIFEKSNIAVARSDDGKFYIERQDGTDTYLGILDATNRTFYSAKPTIVGGRIEYKPLDNIEEARGLLVAGLVAHQRDSSISFNKAVDALHSKFEAGKDYKQGEKREIFNSVCDLGKIIYDTYFAKNNKTFTFNEINKNITPDLLDASGANSFVGDKAFNFFTNVGERQSPPGVVNNSTDVFNNFFVNKNISPEERKEAISKIERLHLQIDDNFLDVAYLFKDKIDENRKKAELGLPSKPGLAYLAGPSGSGKTYITHAVAAALGKELTIFTCNAQTSINDLWYSKNLKDGNSVNTESSVIDALKNGKLLLIDEVNNLRDRNLLAVLNSAIANGYFNSPDGERVLIHPEANIVMAGNYGHRGTQSILDSINDRVNLTIFFRPMSEEAMRGIIVGNARDKLEYSAFKNRIDMNELESALGELAKIIAAYNNQVYDSSRDEGSSSISNTDYATIRQLIGTEKQCVNALTKELTFGRSITPHKALYDCIMNAKKSPFNNRGSEDVYITIKHMVDQSDIYVKAHQADSTMARRRRP